MHELLIRRGIIEMTENADEAQISSIDVSLETKSAALARAATEIAANIDAGALAAFSETAPPLAGSQGTAQSSPSWPSHPVT